MTPGELLLKDPAVSDLQRSHKIFESLPPPAADMIKHLKPDTTPAVYLQILDSAYVTGNMCFSYHHHTTAH